MLSWISLVFHVITFTKTAFLKPSVFSDEPVGIVAFELLRGDRKHGNRQNDGQATNNSYCNPHCAKGQLLLHPYTLGMST